jgi:anti-anti-sigma regulatory factor
VRSAQGARTDKVLVLSLESTASGAIVLHCQGSVISRSEARGLTSLITEVLPTARRLVVDLAGVISLDSGALGELVVTQMWAEAAGYGLKFSSPTDSVRRLFEPPIWRPSSMCIRPLRERSRPCNSNKSIRREHQVFVSLATPPELPSTGMSAGKNHPIARFATPYARALRFSLRSDRL